MKGISGVLVLFNNKQEHIVNTSKYMITEDKCLLNKSLVALQAKLSTSQNVDIMCGHDQNKRKSRKQTSSPNIGTFPFQKLLSISL